MAALVEADSVLCYRLHIEPDFILISVSQRQGRGFVRDSRSPIQRTVCVIIQLSYSDVKLNL